MIQVAGAGGEDGVIEDQRLLSVRLDIWVVAVMPLDMDMTSSRGAGDLLFSAGVIVGTRPADLSQRLTSQEGPAR